MLVLEGRAPRALITLLYLEQCEAHTGPYEHF